MPNQRQIHKDWESMLYFAIALIAESKVHKGTGFIGERIIILHLDHANELLMKSFLIKKGYTVEYLEKNEVNKGVKKEEIKSKSKTILYQDCINLVCKHITFEKEKIKKVMEFHYLRNEIQHRSLDVPLNKEEHIRLFFPLFRELFGKMFPEYEDTFPKMSEIVNGI